MKAAPASRSRSLAWLALGLAGALAALAIPARADDTDIYLGASGGQATNPSILIVVDNTSSNDASYSSSCPYSSGPPNLPNGTLLDMVYCALYGVLESVRTQPLLYDKLNIGLMSGGAGSNKGGSMYYPSTAPYNLPVMDGAGITAFQRVIAAGIPKATGNAKLDGDMQEALAFFSGGTGRSGTTYSPHIGTAACQASFIILIGAAAKQGRPCNGSGCGSASELAAAGASTAQQQQISTASLGPYTSDDGSWIDEWARYLNQTDFNQNLNDPQNVITYTIAAGGAEPPYNQILASTAKQGGGKAFVGTDYTSMVQALLQIFEEIQSVNSTFASAALPSNISNRSLNDNQVFIGMFRPDPAAQPRWFGNMKQYKLTLTGSIVDLADASGAPAIDNNTGFVTSCATSFYTTDSSTYWQNTTYTPRPAGTCLTTSNSAYSDAPDGPFVEKGGIAEVIRRGNSAATNATPTWAVNRTLYTERNGALVAFDTTNSGLAQTLVDFVSGKNTNDENQGFLTTSQTRPSLHGDVIHSRALPVNYGGSRGSVVYYGANDGTLRAAEVTPATGTGRELWAFIAPEFFAARTHAEATPASINPLQRLKDNDPVVLYPGITNPPASAAYRDYFFDGPIGLYKSSGNPPSTVWIYPTTRRGGRMMYGLDVTVPTSPTFKWKVGCPDLTDDDNCTSGTTGIGQTWSLPKVVRIKGYSTTSPAIIVGGGYATCEDVNWANPTCTGTALKGNHVYVFDAASGALVKTFVTDRSVAADVSIVDIDGDGMIDHAYVADTGGSLYRIDFVDPAGGTTRTARDVVDWTITKIAYTTGAGRKFLFAPALWAWTEQGQGKIYVALGSGDREHPLRTQYPYTTPVLNRFYVFVDDVTATPTTATDLDDPDLMIDRTNATDCSYSILSASNVTGWYIDLDAYGTGEQTVSSALIVGGLVAFNTNRPKPSEAGTCGNLGDARGYWLNLFNASGAIGTTDVCGGSRSTSFVGGGLAPSPVLVSVPINSPTDKPTEVVIGAAQRSGGSSTPISPQVAPTNASSKRKLIYWNMGNDK